MATRHPRMPPVRRSSRFTLILAALLTVSVVLLMLLVLGIFSLPLDSNGPTKSGDQWAEVLSWEPRAFKYHNFLVGSLLRKAESCWRFMCMPE